MAHTALPALPLCSLPRSDHLPGVVPLHSCAYLLHVDIVITTDESVLDISIFYINIIILHWDVCPKEVKTFFFIFYCDEIHIT